VGETLKIKVDTTKEIHPFLAGSVGETLKIDTTHIGFHSILKIKIDMTINF